MARNRTVKPDYWTSEQVMRVCRDARLLFIGLWNFCDDYGRHPLSAERLKAEIFPGDTDMPPARVRELLGELEQARLVDVYAVGGKDYLLVAEWHPKIDRPSKPKWPAPPKTDSTSHQRDLDEPPASDRRAFDETSMKGRRSIAEYLTKNQPRPDEAPANARPAIDEASTKKQRLTAGTSTSIRRVLGEPSTNVEKKREEKGIEGSGPEAAQPTAAPTDAMKDAAPPQVGKGPLPLPEQHVELPPSLPVKEEPLPPEWIEACEEIKKFFRKVGNSAPVQPENHVRLWMSLNYTPEFVLSVIHKYVKSDFPKKSLRLFDEIIANEYARRNRSKVPQPSESAP